MLARWTRSPKLLSVIDQDLQFSNGVTVLPVVYKRICWSISHRPTADLVPTFMILRLRLACVKLPSCLFSRFRSMHSALSTSEHRAFQHQSKSGNKDSTKPIFGLHSIASNIEGKVGASTSATMECQSYQQVQASPEGGQPM